MATFDDFIADVLEGVKALAVGALKNYATELTSDTRSFLESTREKTERWGSALRDGQLTPQEFSFLMKSQKDLALMAALAAAGIGAARLKRLRDDLIELIIGRAIGFFSPADPAERWQRLRVDRLPPLKKGSPVRSRYDH